MQETVTQSVLHMTELLYFLDSQKLKESDGVQVHMRACMFILMPRSNKNSILCQARHFSVAAAVSRRPLTFVSALSPCPGHWKAATL